MNLHSQVNKQWNNDTTNRNMNSLRLRPGGYQRSSTCRTMYDAPILRRDIWDNCFVEVTSSGLASYPQPGSPQADSMVLFGAFCNFLCTKKIRKKLFQNDLNECIFVYVHEKEAIQKCEQGRLLCWIKTGKLVCLVAFCVFRLFLFLFFLSFNFFYYYYFFLLSLLHHNKTFSTNIHRGTHREKKAPVGAMMKQSHSLVQRCVQWHWLLLGRQTWYCVLSHPPLSFNCT